MEQILGRTFKDYRPYKTSSEFQEALLEWLDSQLVNDNFDGAARKAASAYVFETLTYLNQVGLAHTWNYHKAAFKAVNSIPPRFRPLEDGPMYIPGYQLHIAPYLHEHKSRWSSSSSSSTSSVSSSKKRPRQTRVITVEKKNHKDDTYCSYHQTNSHSSAECNVLQNKKRSKTDTAKE
jgi:hypothetical protein